MNKCEIEAREQLIREGWKVLRNGWPDFICTKMVRGKMEFMVVEVKHNTDKLREEQLFIKEFFRLINVPYRVISIGKKHSKPLHPKPDRTTPEQTLPAQARPFQSKPWLFKPMR
jgi:hypothetical protein